MTRTTDVLVAGAGVIGTAIAWRAAQRGLSVVLADPSPGSGASATAAGMLAPVTELHYGETALLGLNRTSAERYPGFVAEVEDATGRRVGYARCGTLQVAFDHADLAGLRDLHAYQRSLGLTAELLSAAEVRAHEPGLANGLPGGLLAPDDHQVDPRRLHAALLHVALAAGVQLRASRVVGVRISGAPGSDTPGSRLAGAVLEDGSELALGTLVLATGSWARQLDGLPTSVRPPVRPVKGQTLRLRAPGPGLLSHVVRASVRGSPVYLVPRSDGEVVVGASSEEAGFDLRPRTGAVYELLRDASAVLPGISETEFVQVSTGLRPGSPDNAPLLGESGLAGLVLAVGHFRNGVLLAPVTADGIAALVTDGVPPAELRPFAPTRFARPPERARSPEAGPSPAAPVQAVRS